MKALTRGHLPPGVDFRPRHFPTFDREKPFEVRLNNDALVAIGSPPQKIQVRMAICSCSNSRPPELLGFRNGNGEARNYQLKWISIRFQRWLGRLSGPLKGAVEGGQRGPAYDISGIELIHYCPLADCWVERQAWVLTYCQVAPLMP